MQERARPRAVELQAELTVVQEQIEHFSDRARSSDVRIRLLLPRTEGLRVEELAMSESGANQTGDPDQD